MTVRKRLIEEEIIYRSLEEDGIISSWFDTDEKWKKTVSILQETGPLVRSNQRFWDIYSKYIFFAKRFTGYSFFESRKKKAGQLFVFSELKFPK